MERIKREYFLNNIIVINRRLSLDNVQGDITTFRHIVSIGGIVELDKKIVITRVDVTIHNGDSEEILGGLKVDFVYGVSDFDDVFVRQVVDDTEDILKVLAQESLAAMRGLMFENFRGTLLHNAYLPILSNSNFGKQLKTEPITKKVKRKA